MSRTVAGLPTLLLTPEQAAEVCQVSRAKLDEWTHRAGFPVIREGSIVRVPLELLKVWIAEQALATNAPREPVVQIAFSSPVRRR
jgi:excisionase family DNA binding protein